MKQIVDKKDLIGKTIKRYYESSYDFWIRFTDDSFVVFKYENRTQGFGQEHEGVVVDDFHVENTSPELVQLGLITRSEYEYACEEEDRQYELRKQKRETENQQQEIERELQLLQELKKKYES